MPKGGLAAPGPEGEGGGFKVEVVVGESVERLEEEATVVSGDFLPTSFVPFNSVAVAVEGGAAGVEEEEDTAPGLGNRIA